MENTNVGRIRGMQEVTYGISKPSCVDFEARRNLGMNRLLEACPGARGGIALHRLVERLRRKADWLDMRIALEL